MAANATYRHVLITGPPGIGKTTVVRSLCESLSRCVIPVQGFYTEEVRVNGRRQGFDVVTLSGQRGRLARVSGTGDEPGGRREYRVGQYSVNLSAFEQTALPTIQSKEPGASASVFVIDEIGKMEMFSASFVQTVRHLVNKPHTVVLATIPITRGKPIPLVEELRGRKDAKLFTISRENRDGVLDEILKTVKESYDVCGKT